MNNIKNNDRRFIYLYFNRNEPEKIRKFVPSHIQYWKAANLQGYLGGPFSDRTGGLISFLASSLEKVSETIQQDPFVLEDLIEQKWIKEWIIE